MLVLNTYYNRDNMFKKLRWFGHVHRMEENGEFGNNKIER